MKFLAINEAIDAENFIIISDSTLRNILLPHMNKTTSWYKVMCGCECFISAKNMKSPLLTWCNFSLKHLKDMSHNEQNRQSGEISSRIFETYNTSVQPHLHDALPIY